MIWAFLRQRASLGSVSNIWNRRLFGWTETRRRDHFLLNVNSASFELHWRRHTLLFYEVCVQHLHHVHIFLPQDYCCVIMLRKHPRFHCCICFLCRERRLQQNWGDWTDSISTCNVASISCNSDSMALEQPEPVYCCCRLKRSHCKRITG